MSSWIHSSLALVLVACTPEPDVETEKPSTSTISITSPTPDTPADSATEPTETSTTSTSTSTSTTEVAEPSLSFTLSPDPVLAGEIVQVEVFIENYTLVDPTTTPPPTPAEGEGHFHIYADGAYIGALWVDAFELQTSAEDAGASYELRLALVDSGHNELDPPVEALGTLTVE